MARGWMRGLASVLAMVVVVQLMPEVPGLPVGTAQALAQPVDPVPPPTAVEPDHYLQVVDDAGPTQVPRWITTDTVWGPQGSPYIVDWTDVESGVTLTLLPGTVVKMSESAVLQVFGQILALGNPDNRVTITSIRDDTVMGDTNGDGDATAPARGDWVQISIAGGAGSPTSVFDYVDIRYGGNDFEGCVTWGAIQVNTDNSRVVVSNSRFEHVQTGVRVGGPGHRGFVGIYNSHFESGRCGVSVRGNAYADVVGNTFGADFIELAVQAESLGRFRFWFNTVHGAVRVFNVFGGPPTRQEADIRFNALLGIVNEGPFAGTYPLPDWSGNWFGHDANDDLPTCMDPNVCSWSTRPGGSP